MDNLKAILSNHAKSKEGTEGHYPGCPEQGWTNTHQEYAEGWKGHLEEFLNPMTCPRYRRQCGVSGEMESISVAEVTEVVGELCSGKTAGVDEIHPQNAKGTGCVWAVMTDMPAQYLNMNDGDCLLVSAHMCSGNCI